MADYIPATDAEFAECGSKHQASALTKNMGPSIPSQPDLPENPATLQPAKAISAANANEMATAVSLLRETEAALREEIVGRQHAQAAQSESEDRYRRIVQSAGIGIWMIDAQARTTIINPKMAQMLGYEINEMIGRPLADFMDGDGRGFVEANLERRRLGISEEHEFKFTRKDGSPLWTSITTNPLTDNQGNHAGALAMITDITSLKTTQARETWHSRTTTLMATGAPLPAILDSVVRGIEAQHPGMLCSVLLMDPTGTRLLNGAAPSLPVFYNQAISGVVIGPSVGSCGTAAHLAARVIVTDIATDPLWANFTLLAARAGLASCWSEPIMGASGKVLGTFAIYHRQIQSPGASDIETIANAAQLAAVAIEQYRADEALQEQREFLDAIVQNEPECIKVINAAGKLVQMNRAGLAMLEVDTLEEAQRHDLLDFIHPDYRDRFRALHELVCSSTPSTPSTPGAPGAPPNPFPQNSLTFLLQGKKGTPRWLETHATPFFDRRSGTVSLLAVTRDVTEHVRAQAALHESEAFNIAVLDSLAKHIAVLDQHGVIVATNRRWRQFAEMNDASQQADSCHIGANYLEVCEKAIGGPCGDEAHAVLKGIRAVLHGEQSEFNLEYPCHSPSTQRWFRLNVTPLGGSRRGAVVSHENITAPMMAEREREKLQAQLLQSQKMESVGRLAGGVAHDFNNMLVVILGYTELAMAQVGHAHPVFDSLRQIREAGQRSADLTRQLLTYARKHPINPRVLNLNETVESMLRMLHRIIGENIHIIWKPASLTGLVRIDPTQVDQILANLSINARDAIGGATGGILTIETDDVAAADIVGSTYPDAPPEHQGGTLPGEYVRLSVTDNGCGMEQATLEHLFEPFFTTKALGKGTGLGCAMVYGIVRQNGGFINVQSKPARGTTFSIYLPRIRSAQTSPQAAAGIKPAGGTETVLLVEDEAAILALVRTTLNEYGYNVLMADTPATAIDLAHRYDAPIELLLTDMVMPGMNGNQLKDLLVRLRPAMKVLFMSGYAADVIAPTAPHNETIHFLQKPFSLAELTAKVRSVLDS